MNWYDAQNWLDLVDHAWYGIVLIIVAGIPSWLSARNHRSLKAIHGQTEAIRGQVVNGHEKPMREDLDRAIGALDKLTTNVETLRTELADEHHARREQIRELRQDVDARLSTLHSRLTEK